MYNLIRADFFKMRKSQVIKILFAITTVCSVIMVFMAYLIYQGKIDSKMTGIGFMFSDINIISIIGAAIAAVFICGDFENKTIHDAVACGSSRSSIIIGKSVVFFCSVAFVLLPYAISTGIALGTGSKFSMGSVGLGFLNVLTQDSGKVFQASGFFKLLIVMLTLVIVYAAQLSLCVPLSVVFKKPILVVAVYYGFTILCAQLIGLGNSYPLVKNVLSCMPYASNYSLLTIDAGPADIAKAISVSLVFIIAILAVTYSVFRKSEIK